MPEPSAMPIDLGARFDNAYARLPEQLFSRVEPTPVARPSLLALNRELAVELGLPPERLASDEAVAVLAGSRSVDGAEPLAMAYAGHQFGHWVPQLGDGRAILLGELVDSHGVRREVQLKGAGRTPWSRGGDGRAGIGPVLREYVLGEAMHALGVPTTRALAAVATGETVLRERPLPGAVLTRVARSHVRVGTFQYVAARGDTEALTALMMHVLEHHYPALLDADRPALALLDAVMQRQAALVAHWMSAGFIHGVMNTDNCSVLGDTIDYGPCAFMDDFAADRVFSSIDVQARYAWGNQPAMAHWNTAQLAQCLLPLIDADKNTSLGLAQASVDGFDALFSTCWDARLGAKLGFAAGALEDPAQAERIRTLGKDYLGLLQANEADFTQGFRALRDIETLRGLLDTDPAPLEAWWATREALLEETGTDRQAAQATMRANNPVRIPRNHQVERMIEAATEGDLEPMRALQAALAHPFDEDPALAAYERPPTPDERVQQTFCGT